MTGTRRSRSHGEATLAVSSASTQTCHVEPACSVSAQNTAIAVQPPNRCESSNASWARRRTTGEAQTAITRVSATSVEDSTSVVTDTDAASRAWATIATAVNAHSQAVPASAAPTWMPPT